MLMRNLEAIAKGSTSPDHVIMEKLYVEESIYASDFGRIDNGILSTLGAVRQIESEVKLPNEWRADHVETLDKLVGDTTINQTRAVEVLTGFSHTFWCHSDRSGRKYAEAFMEYLKERRLVTDSVLGNMRLQLKIKEIGKHEEAKPKFIHFWLRDPLDNTRKIDYREFNSDVDNPSEIERKYMLWDGQTDSIGFFVLNDYALNYLFELSKLKKKLEVDEKNFKVDMLATIPYGDLEQVRMGDTKKTVNSVAVAKRPDYLKNRPLVQKWYLGELDCFG